MKHFLLTSLLIMNLVGALQAQTFDFAKHISATGQAWPLDVDSDTHGNIYVCGFFYGTIDLDPGAGVESHTSHGAEDAFLAKYSPTGQFIWGYSWGSTGIDRCNAIAIAHGVELLTVVGQFTGTVLFPPVNTSLTSHNSGTNIDGFSLSLDLAGAIVGVINMGGTSGWVQPIDVGYTLPGESTFYVCGSLGGTVDMDGNSGTTNLTAGAQKDAFVAQYTTALNLLWAVNADGPNGDENAKRLVVKEFGQVYVVGDFNGITDFDPSVNDYDITPHGTRSTFVWKLDGSGNNMWARGFGSASFTDPGGITLAANGDVIVVGSYLDDGDMDPSSAVYNLPTATNADGFINRISSTGDFVSAKHISGLGDEYLFDVKSDPQGHLLICGGFTEDIDVDPSTAVVSYTKESGSNINGFVVQYDALIDYDWSHHFSATSVNRTHSCTYQPNGGQLIVGDFGGTTDIPSVGGVSLGPASVNDPYIVRFHDITIDVTEQESELQLIYDAASQTVLVNGLLENAVLNVYDMSGKQLQSRQISNKNNAQISPLSAGFYLLELVTAKNRRALKIGINK